MTNDIFDKISQTNNTNSLFFFGVVDNKDLMKLVGMNEIKSSLKSVRRKDRNNFELTFVGIDELNESFGILIQFIKKAPVF